MARVGFACHPLFLEHETGPFHPESPERLMAIVNRLRGTGLIDKTWPIEPMPADLSWIETIHDPSYVRSVRATCPAEGIAHLDPDTVVSPKSFDAALLAAGAVLSAVDAVMEGRVQRAFCAVRPPGHHALPGRAMGFCLFNNVAIGARYAKRKHGLARVLIVDFDVHHGNGTQAAFYDDPSVLFFSTHQFPHYPGTGRAEERGVGEGTGFTINAPLPPGARGEDVLRAFDSLLVPAVESFRPEIVLVSAGFDGHVDDPLARFELTDEDYLEIARRIAALAEKHANGRVVSVLEGGYNLSALARSVEAHIQGLMENRFGVGSQE